MIIPIVIAGVVVTGLILAGAQRTEAAQEAVRGTSPAVAAAMRKKELGPLKIALQTAQRAYDIAKSTYDKIPAIAGIKIPFEVTPIAVKSREQIVRIEKNIRRVEAKYPIAA